MSSMFRRQKSPRTAVEFKNTAGLVSADDQHKRNKESKGRSFSVHHRRHRSDEFNNIIESIETSTSFLSQSEEVEDYQLSDPSPFPPPQLPPRHRGGSGGNFTHSYSKPGWRRTRSSGTMSGQQLSQQPPTQEYFVPVDTLRNVQRTAIMSPHSNNGIIGGPQQQQQYHHPHSIHTIKDKRNKEMHKKIVEQNDPSVLMSKRKSRSLENLIDTNDYSTPFDVVPERTLDQQGKSRSPEGQNNLLPGSHFQGQARSDTNLTLHSTSSPPSKPARRTRDILPPPFAPPPPPTEDTTNCPHSPVVVRKGDDYEEPWSSRFHIPKPGPRKQRSDTESAIKPTTSPSSDTHRSSRAHRSHTIHHEMSPETEVPGVPPRSSSRNRDIECTQLTPTSPQLDTHQRTVTGESLVTDYCIPPDAILHDYNGVNHRGVAGLGRERIMHDYVNQPPIPPQISSLRNEKKHGYPALLPSDHYITDIQNLPPPAFPIDTSLPLEDQPWFHGKISRDQAEDILWHQPDFSFLLRKSESSRMDYSLSIRDRTSPAAQGFIHLKITHEKGGYVLGQFSAPFFSVSLCIAFYTQRELTIKHINHRRLGFPVGKIKSMQQQL